MSDKQDWLRPILEIARTFGFEKCKLDWLLHAALRSSLRLCDNEVVSHFDQESEGPLASRE